MMIANSYDSGLDFQLAVDLDLLRSPSPNAIYSFSTY
jgi:hypothetical protein